MGTFLESFMKLVNEGQHPCSCGALMESDDDMRVCPKCGLELEKDCYGDLMEEVEEREGYYDIPDEFK